MRSMTSAAAPSLDMDTVRDPQPRAPSPAAVRPSAWKFAVTFDAAELKQADPVGMLLDAVVIFPGVRFHTRQLCLVLSELYANALDHGLLGLDVNCKAQPGGLERYLERKRAALDALAHGSIDISLLLDPVPEPLLHITMRDSGPGFDHQAWPPAAPARGRGIALVKALCATVEYRGRGNEVSVSYVVSCPPAERLRRVA